MFRSYISKEDREEADSQLPRLMGEGLLLGGTGLGVLALIFEIAADAFSVAAYQTLLAIEGAGGNHDVAIIAFSLLSIMLFLGVVPAYKAASYLRPNAGGSGPLAEAIGPDRFRWASWVGTSLFFMDAVLTIIISSISASDVTMLLLPELSDFRILLAEIYAFFIMAVLVALGPKRAVPLFLIGGGAFTIFTLGALSYVGVQAAIDPSIGDGTHAIVERLQQDGVIEELHHEIEVVGRAAFLSALLGSMSSAMLGFSGYEVIPASGKHAAKPKWKVINTALTMAAVFLIGTGILQLFAARTWDIPATVGYSTLLVEYELVFGTTSLLTIAGVLLAIILLLAQGGGYVGGAAVASNAAKLGRMPKFFEDDRIGIAVIWGFAAVFIPIIRSVVEVEAYYAFGFVSAFVITSTTVFFVRDDVFKDAGIEIGSDEAKSLKFAGLRGMIASYAMLVILITQKTDALPVIVIGGVLITAFQLFISRGGVEDNNTDFDPDKPMPIIEGKVRFNSGLKRAYDEARQEAVVEIVNDLISEGALNKFNVEPSRIHRLVSYTHAVDKHMWEGHDDDGEHHHDEVAQPSRELQAVYERTLTEKQEVLDRIEHYSHYGIFTFIQKYSHNWVSPYRDEETVERAMIKALFPLTPTEEVWAEFENYGWERVPESVWQFCRQRYQWAKDQWPNLSDRITTIWTLQDLGLVDREEDAEKLLSSIVIPHKFEDGVILDRDVDEIEEILEEDIDEEEPPLDDEE